MFHAKNVFVDNDGFIDDSGNHVKEVAFGNDDRFRVIVLLNTPSIGYVTDAKFGDIYPGPCLTWFGPGERFATITEAVDYCGKHYRT
jgi:hypothetical protein